MMSGNKLLSNGLITTTFEIREKKNTQCSAPRSLTSFQYYIKNPPINFVTLYFYFLEII